ncbi:aminoacyl-tRNA deacylase [Spelaeicoccus albus]|uniref:Cys-tRNA(Pro) deacylase n=1 Tax=Spelaeicoccus albus TaxID=1280376 RepID=A0A7Z0CZY1_9MICO|nr:YbaK/EbsC family protein [Spelaeicoccus albus]NYI66791.1 Cys-tRNA(Pro) deacylase [Spelaeicoccus albus]
MAGIDGAQADAQAHGLAVEFRQRPDASSLEEAAALLDIEPREIVKSLIVRNKHDYLFALIPGDRHIAWPKLRAIVGANKLSMPPADEAFEATGYEHGTITPIGSSRAWPIYADEHIVGRRIAMGAGAHGYSAFVDADALIAAYGAVVADISA